MPPPSPFSFLNQHCELPYLRVNEEQSVANFEADVFMTQHKSFFVPVLLLTGANLCLTTRAAAKVGQTAVL